MVHGREGLPRGQGSLRTDRRSDEGLRFRPRDGNFLVRGMQMNGHVFGQDADDEATLTTRLFNQDLFLCEREQKVPDQIEVEHLACGSVVQRRRSHPHGVGLSDPHGNARNQENFRLVSGQLVRI